MLASIPNEIWQQTTLFENYVANQNKLCRNGHLGRNVVKTITMDMLPRITSPTTRSSRTKDKQHQWRARLNSRRHPTHRDDTFSDVTFRSVSVILFKPSIAKPWSHAIVNTSPRYWGGNRDETMRQIREGRHVVKCGVATSFVRTLPVARKQTMRMLLQCLMNVEASIEFFAQDIQLEPATVFTTMSFISDLTLML